MDGESNVLLFSRREAKDASMLYIFVLHLIYL